MLPENLLKEISAIVHQTAIIKTEKIPFRQYVVDACAMNACGRYGKTWQCPPGVGDFETLRKKVLSFAYALVFTTVHPLEDSFDIEGMEAGRVGHEKITDKVVELFGDRKIKVLSAEGCSLCKECTYPNAPCRFPNKARSSVEANGISVVELAKQIDINYKNGNNTVTYFSMIFY